MQLYALTNDGLLVEAFDAKKQFDYFCPECNSVIRLREGEINHPHFYHLQKQVGCRQQGKGAIHLHIQKKLQTLLEGAIIEKRFPEIRRIADVAWEKEKIIFEIQFSPMKRKEMLERSLDYKSIGYQIIWILHDQRYNQWKVSALESGLKSIPHYFTDVNEKGEGMIYDQWSLIERGIRKEKFSKWPINLQRPHKNTSSLRKNWPLYFEGDLSSLPHDHTELAKIMTLEECSIKRASFFKIFKNWLSSYWKSTLKTYCE